jgi:malate synthase
LWQWYKHKVVLDNDETVDDQLLSRELDSFEENEKTRKYVTNFICSSKLEPFLTSKLYPDIV